MPTKTAATSLHMIDKGTKAEEMNGGEADPLADIPHQKTSSPRDVAGTFFSIPMAIRPDECEALLDLFHLYDSSGHTKSLTHSTRLERVYLGGCPHVEKANPEIFVPDGTAKIYSRLSSLIHMQNAMDWKFDLVPNICITPFCMLDLQKEGGTGVSWHADGTNFSSHKDVQFEPKLIVIAQLSDPADYDGGEFEVYSGNQIFRPVLEQGDVVLFPSFLLHRRQPITRGQRFILGVNAWGPHWR